MAKNASATERQHKQAGQALERRVLRYVREQRLLGGEERVVVGVSGGADSTALLLILARLAPRLGMELRAAHFDHRLRGKAAARREREFLARLADSLGVPLLTGEGDVRAHARDRRLGLEEAARELRYAFLARAARENGARSVAVGHTADDQVETVLMHILRGSGLTGLAGMLPRSPWPVAADDSDGLSLLRPLLTVRRQETEAYCREMGWQPLEDSTNRSPRYRRNRLRHRLLPLLREYNPRLDDALLRLASAVALERQALAETAAEKLAALGSSEGGAARLSLSGLRSLPAGLRLQVLRLAAGQVLGNVQDIGTRHLRAMADAADKTAGTRLDLPRRLGLRVEYGSLVLFSMDEEAVDALPDGETALAVPGRTAVGRWLFDASVESPAESALSASDEWEVSMNVDALIGDLRVRRRRRGDRFRPLGLAGEKKLQDLLVDAKVPRDRRDAVPVVCDAHGIVWVAGQRLAERVRVTASTRRVLRLRVSAVESLPAGSHQGSKLVQRHW
jgi:tRNA(Ile)-lysidine synthase